MADKDCIFCKIAQHKIPSKIVYEDEDIIAFRDIDPKAPVHILLIPKRHIPSIKELTETDEKIVGKIHRISQKIADGESIAQSGFRIVANTGPDAGQAVAHLHFHLIGGRKLSWPPG